MGVPTKRPHFQPKKLVIVAFEGVDSLDVTGPYSVFAKAEEMHPGSYSLMIATPTGGTVRAFGGLVFAQTISLQEVPDDAHTILVAGGDEPALLQALASPLPAWLAGRANCPRVGSICTGAFLLAAAGLLDQRRATTHWRAAARLKQAFPSVLVDADPIFVCDGVYTSAGITAGIDLSLALVAADHGQALTNAIARELVVYARRAGGQSQYSGALAAQASAGSRIAPVIEWILNNLAANTSVTELAARASMTERSFARLFKQETGMTPARFVVRARVDRAMMFLETTDWPLARVSQRSGFGSVDAIQRAFRQSGFSTPSMYRLHFGAARFAASPKRSVGHQETE